MRAAQYDRYGKPEVLHVSEVAVPVPGPGEVVVRVHGSGVNRVDAAVRRGAVRIATGRRFPKGTGMDFAGEITAIGDGVKLAVDAKVWGFLPGLPKGPTGAAAEFVVAKADQLSAAPTTIDLVDAGALPMAGVTALLALREYSELKAGEKLLIRGANGGVGTAALQLGKAMGARVTALVGPNNLDFARELGADAALDYHTHGPDQVGPFDVILDLNGANMAGYRALLPEHGRMVCTATKGVAYILFSMIYRERRVRSFTASPKAEVLADLAGFVDRGELRPIIDSVHPLAEIAEAHRELEAGGSRGKQLVRVL
ncbi:MAG: NADP-dependent oxidoreductase [Salinibacterium sp.]|nr:MAG: NADP-dependent oxidoreductase [Salinibacterium sp.]